MPAQQFDSWREYAVEQYYNVYKPKGYTYAETLKALGAKNKGGAKVRKGANIFQDFAEGFADAVPLVRSVLGVKGQPRAPETATRAFFKDAFSSAPGLIKKAIGGKRKKRKNY